MDIENNYEQKLVFKIEVVDREEKQKIKKKRVVKLASENLKKLVESRLNGRTGECQRIKNKAKARIKV